MLKGMIRHTRVAYTIFIIAGCGFLVSRCVQTEEKKSTIIKNEKGEAFAGSASCFSCHKTIAEHHLQTAHHLTSGFPTDQTILGSFQADSNRYAYNRSVAVVMEKRDQGYYQVEYFKEAEKKARRFDMVIGSGTMGQSFLNWQDHKLFQLPITYFSAARTWSNSPGFPDKVVFNRVITSRCLECHTSFMKIISEPDKSPEQFDNQQMILGVECEKCHGAAASHVEFHSQHPGELSGKYITNPAKLSRQQNLDLCASCHGGRLNKTKPSFTFTVGDKLSDYFEVDTTAPKPENIDVHGNQYGLLRASACFKNSLTLTCNSCHDVHQKEKGNTVLFSQRCLNCHNDSHETKCALTKTMGTSLNSNCIDCHMPVQPSKAIAVQLEGDAMPVSAMIRSHYISIYPEETKRIRKYMDSVKR
jgi:hypothetical protein